MFISVQPSSGTVIDDEDKAAIEEYLIKAGVVTVTPEIVDPDYVFVDTTTAFTYSATASTILAGELETAIKNTIIAYNDANLNSFKSMLRYSNLLTAIDSTDNGIVSNITTYTLAKRFYAKPGVSVFGELKFSNKIAVGSVKSSTFTYGTFTSCSFKSGVGSNLNIVNTVGGIDTIIVSKAGAIDYDAGNITINPMKTGAANMSYFDDMLQSPYIRITATPVESNVSSNHNQIVTIENISVNGRSV